MGKVTVVNKYKEPDHIYCGRGSALGNPFVLGRDGDRDAVCNKYEEWFYQNVHEDKFLSYIEDYGVTLDPIHKMLCNIYEDAERRDINLGCFCAPQRCHCDTIKNFIDNKLEESLK